MNGVEQNNGPANNRNNTRTERGRRRLRRLAIANLAFLIGFWALGEFIGERTWLTTLIAYCPPFLPALPTLLFLLLTLLWRERTALCGNLASALFALTLLMGLHIPGPAPHMENASRLRVLTYNIEHGVGGAQAIAAVVRAYNADVVCFQEINGFGGGSDPYPELVLALPEYQITRFAETAVASRLPVREVQAHPLISQGAYRVATEAVVEVGGKPVSVVAVHLATGVSGETLARRRRSLPGYVRMTAQVRGAQIDALFQGTAEISHPLIVCGDFNTPPHGIFYRRLTERWEDGFAARGFGYGYTYSTGKPVVRIDYVFTGNGARAVHAGVPSVAASDHRPVVAEVAIP